MFDRSKWRDSAQAVGKGPRLSRVGGVSGLLFVGGVTLSGAEVWLITLVRCADVSGLMLPDICCASSWLRVEHMRGLEWLMETTVGS